MLESKTTLDVPFRSYLQSGPIVFEYASQRLANLQGNEQASLTIADFDVVLFVVVLQ